jgi:hypothetical protein
MGTDRIELVYFEGCPQVAEARREISRALRMCRLPPTWREWDTTSPDTPASFKGFCSPTVLVDGIDTCGSVPVAGPACTVAGAPRAEHIVAALQRRTVPT